MATRRDDASNDVVHLTQRLVTEANKVAETFVAVHGMHATDVSAMIRVAEANDGGVPVTAGHLGEHLGLTSGAVTAAVDRLERAQILHRVRDATDRRRVLLELTPGGSSLVEEYLRPVRRRTEGVTAQFSADQLEIIGDYLDKTATAMSAHRADLLAPR